MQCGAWGGTWNPTTGACSLTAAPGAEDPTSCASRGGTWDPDNGICWEASTAQSVETMALLATIQAAQQACTANGGTWATPATWSAREAIRRQPPGCDRHRAGGGERPVHPRAVSVGGGAGRHPWNRSGIRRRPPSLRPRARQRPAVCGTPSTASASRQALPARRASRVAERGTEPPVRPRARTRGGWSPLRWLVACCCCCRMRRMFFGAHVLWLLFVDFCVQVTGARVPVLRDWIAREQARRGPTKTSSKQRR